MKYEDFIAEFPKHRKTGNGVLVPCPAHDDNPKTPSLSVGRFKDGGVLIKCFAGCSAPQVVAALGLTMKDLFAAEPPVKFNFPAARTQEKDSGPEIKPVEDKIYSYRNADGDEVYQAVRMKPKSFRQRHRKNGEWVWNMDGVERVLYRLPELQASDSVWITEGEKDVENLVALGFQATTNIGGSKSWMPSYAENFAEKDVIICGDNDQPGKDYVKAVSESIAEFAKTVRVVSIPATFKDVSDYIASFKNTEDAKAALHDSVSQSRRFVRGHHLPLETISEIEPDYRRFVRSMSTTSFSLGKWLPTLGIKLRNLVPGELMFIIGDTGTGKTGILSNIAFHALPLPTLFFEMELPREIMFERMVSMTMKMPGNLVEQAYQDTDESIKPELDKRLAKLAICSEARLTVEKIEDIINRAELKLGERPKVVLIDYIQLMQSAGQNRREKISDIAEALKVMAKQTRTIVIVASQISRPKDVDKNWEPRLHDAKESGSIETSCGLLLSAWRPPDEPGSINFRVLKSSKGGTGTFVAGNFNGPCMIINERSNISPSDIPERRYHDR